MYTASLIIMIGIGVAASALVLWGIAVMVRTECEAMNRKLGE